MSKFRSLALGATLALAAIASAQAQAWPQRPIALVVPQAAGNSPDILARVLADKLSRSDVDDALGLLRRLTGAEPLLCRLPDEWTTGPPMKSMLRAAKRWRPAGVRHGSAV